MKKKLSSKILMIAVFAIVAIPVAYAINIVAEGFKSDSGASALTIDAHGVCKKVTNISGKSYFIPTKISNEWSAFRSNLPFNVTLEDCVGGAYTLDIKIDSPNYDIAQELIIKYGLPNPIVTPLTVTVTVFPGIYAYATGSFTPALSTGALPPGSTINLINKGTIMGMGGKGGDGGAAYTGGGGTNPYSSGKCYAPQNGFSGGPAVVLTVSPLSVSIDNTAGHIWGGGGGGGGGGGLVLGTINSYGGGGGGGGAGWWDSIAGGGGAGWSLPLASWIDRISGSPGGAGNTVGGAKGAGATGWIAGSKAGDGGKGGEYGQPGVNGEPGSTPYGATCGFGNTAGAPGANGGNAGDAIRTNGNTINWIGATGDVLGPY